MNNGKNTRPLLDQKDIDEIGEALLHAPPPTRQLTRKEALHGLVDQLKEARTRGHTFGSLADVLAAKGLPISARVLAEALRESSPKNARSRRTHVRVKVQSADTPTA